MEHTPLQTKIRELMAKHLRQVEVSDDVYIMVVDSDKAMQELATWVLSNYRQSLIEVAEGEKEKHILDRDIYKDTGGGRMCEVCGEHGYDESKPCNTSKNQGIQTMIDLIKQDTSNE